MRLHIVGRKNHGKTTLVTDLIRCLKFQGYRVGTIKHTHHRHELDTPGKDSHRHRQAGADAVGIISPSLSAAFWAPEPSEAPDYDAFVPLFARCDLVLVEGDSLSSAAKIEVWRASRGTPPMASEDAGILAVVSDDAAPVSVPVLPRRDVAALARWITDQYDTLAAASGLHGSASRQAAGSPISNCVPGPR